MPYSATMRRGWPPDLFVYRRPRILCRRGAPLALSVGVRLSRSRREVELGPSTMSPASRNLADDHASKQLAGRQPEHPGAGVEDSDLGRAGLPRHATLASSVQTSGSRGRCCGPAGARPGGDRRSAQTGLSGSVAPRPARAAFPSMSSGRDARRRNCRGVGMRLEARGGYSAKLST